MPVEDTMQDTGDVIRRGAKSDAGGGRVDKAESTVVSGLKYNRFQPSAFTAQQERTEYGLDASASITHVEAEANASVAVNDILVEADGTRIRLMGVNQQTRPSGEIHHLILIGEILGKDTAS